MRDFRQILIAVVLAVFVAEFIWYLACQCVRYIRLQTRIHSRVSVFIAVGFCLVGMYVSGTKPGTNDVDGADVIYGLMTAYVPSAIGGLTDGYDIYTVTNLYFDSFDKSGTVVRVGISIGEDSIEYGESIRIFAADSLDRPNWTNIYEHEVGYEDSLIAQFDMSLFPTSYLQQAYFGLDFPQDSDGDGVGDGDERYVYHSNPLKYDSDDDGLGDGDEIRLGSNPVLLDTDGDGLTDAEEAGGSLVLADSSFLWLDTSTCTELPLGSGGSYKDWDVMVPGGVSLAGVNYTSCNVSLYGRLSFGQDGVTIDACGQWMYAYPSWFSGVYYGTVATNGVEYFVVEYRNISSDSAGGFKLTCQVLVPLAEGNVVYVSYLQVDDGLDDPVVPLGIGCANMVSPFSSIESYSILPPVGHSSPVPGTTIKYIIGLGSDPSEYNRYHEPELPVGSNSNAYFTVDVVASECAHIVFAGSGVSTLPDPDFFAMPNDTNRVRLLIGKSYDVISSGPIDCVGTSDSDAVVSNVTARSFSVVRPVEIVALEGNGNSFLMLVTPANLGGSFSWLQYCRPITGVDNEFWYAGVGDCGCGGCYAQGVYIYEGFSQLCVGGYCGCPDYDDGDEGYSTVPDDGPYAASVSLSFSKPAVIFEYAYDNNPTSSVPLRSTQTTLTCVVHGGEAGGSVEFEMVNASKLSSIGSSLPGSIFVPPAQKLEFEVDYEGAEPSANVNDIVVTGIFTPRNGGTELSDSDSMTSIRLELEAELAAPTNNCPQRHWFGVFETVDLHLAPDLYFDECSLDGDDSYFFSGGKKFWCPWTNGTYNVEIGINGVAYSSPIRVFEPSVCVRNPRWTGSTGSVGVAGTVLMDVDLYVKPFDVSFCYLWIEEVPDDSQSGAHSGYYDDRSRGGNWSHTTNDGAGVWHCITSLGAWGVDRAGRNLPYDGPYCSGWKEWEIPVGYGEQNTVPRRIIDPNPTTQRFEMDADGTVRIIKWGHTISRDVDNSVFLDGNPVNER